MSRQYPTDTILGARMHQLGWTATSFATECHIHPRTLTEYLAGRKDPTADHLFRMADVLGMDVEDFTATD
jgi:plasmid maintenance system antidote protein VapI